MQVTELSAEGLKREYKVVVPAGEIEDRVNRRLDEIRRTARMPGFRPGKVPVTLLRKQYGRSVMGEVLEQAVNHGSQQAISEHALRPALRPKIEVTAFDEGRDLEFTMALELLPEMPEVDLKGMQLTRLTAEVSEATVDQALQNFARRRQDFAPLAEPRPSQDGDRLIIDFEGRIDGEPFEGGKAEDFPLMLGAGSTLPGFEDKLQGVSAGDEVEVETTFPEEYGAAEVAGRTARFQVKVKEIQAPQPIAIDDDFAKAAGFESLEAMQQAVRESVEREYARFARARLKRALLDQLAATYRFEVPPGMVDLEFEAIWKQVSEELARAPEEARDRSEDELKQEYREIAERRVRLGLILSDIGQKNELKVEQHELNAALVEQARRFPGQEQKVLEFFKSTPGAIEQVRAPLYEDKVVDFIVQMAQVEERTVTPEELMRDPDEEGEAVSTAEPAPGQTA